MPENNFKKVSVIIPTYNGDKYITKAVDSVLSQTFKDFEIIVVDDESTNDVYSVLKPYIDNNIVKYIRQKNSGPGQARKNGILNSSGEYIAYIDDDDLWSDRDKLQKQVEFLDNNSEYVIVGTAGRVFYEDDNEYADYNVLTKDEDIRKMILIGNQFIQSSLMVRRSSLGDLSNYPLTRAIEDYLLILDLGKIGKFKNLKDKMVIYTNRTGNLTNNGRKNMLKNNIKIIGKYKNYYPRYREALVFYIIKYLGYLLIDSTGKINKNLRNKLLKFALKTHRKIVSNG